MKEINNFSEKPGSPLRHKAESVLKDFEAQPGKNFSAHEIHILLNELQVYRLELEMQNDELRISSHSLELERSKFVSLFDHSPVGYFIADHLGIIENVNQRGIDLLEIQKDKIVSNRLQSFLAPESWEPFYGFLHRIQNSDSRQTADIMLFLNQEKLVHTRMEGIVLQDALLGSVKYYIAVIDITESRKAQLKLQDTKDRLEMTLSASSTGTWNLDLTASRVFLDEFSYQVLGLKLWEFDGTLDHFMNLILEEDRHKVRISLFSVISKNQQLDIEFRIFLKSGELKYISAKGHKLSSVDGTECIAGILIDVTERKSFELQAEKNRQEQEKLVLSATLTAQEKERFKISRALHDSVCQILYGIRLNLQNIQLTSGTATNFSNINHLLDLAIKETRQISFDLTPSILKDFGFTAGITEMAERLSTPHFKIETSIKKIADILPPNVQLYIFRIIQELINNTINHAQASLAHVIVKSENNLVTVIVSDNGKGIRGKLDNQLKKGSGIRGIRSRVYLLGGTIEYKTAKTGTSVTIQFKNNTALSDIESI